MAEEGLARSRAEGAKGGPEECCLETSVVSWKEGVQETYD